MNEKLEELRKKVEECRKCDLWKKREKVVFGEGPSNSRVMLIGLGPGFHENREGRPFVGAAGKFLNQLLELAGLKREEVFITNVIKCYLPENKASEEEIKACTPYLDEQIKIIRPRIIIALGQVAASYLISKFNLNVGPVSKLHGKVFDLRNLWGKVKLVVMYHPATALYNPRMREILIKDWTKIKTILNE